MKNLKTGLTILLLMLLNISCEQKETCELLGTGCVTYYNDVFDDMRIFITPNEDKEFVDNNGVEPDEGIFLSMGETTVVEDIPQGVYYVFITVSEGCFTGRCWRNWEMSGKFYVSPCETKIITYYDLID